MLGNVLSSLTKGYFFDLAVAVVAGAIGGCVVTWLVLR
jgi:large-conductance mechanosensitive channel